MIFITGGQKPKTPGGVAPTFKEKPKVAQDASGKNLVIECRCSSNPKPEVLWFKDGVSLPMNARIKPTITGAGNDYVIKLEITVSYKNKNRGKSVLYTYKIYINELT